ncbi:hypothetical protein THF5H11_30106 [Vibrio jasicida]|nr:hypothetical protein THF5H11_30106 [Vibrio jasicida]CAH1605075.1 hypothetical protein THF5G08_110124 [Vibrio jasicida]
MKASARLRTGDLSSSHFPYQNVVALPVATYIFIISLLGKFLQ